MPARAGAHQDQPVHPGVDGLLGMIGIGHVVEDQPAVAVHRVHHFLHRPQAGDDQRDLLAHDHLQVRLHARVGFVYDEVDAVGGQRPAAALGLLGQRPLDLDYPLLEARRRAVVEGGKGTQHSAFAALQDKLLLRYDKHGRDHHGNIQVQIRQNLVSTHGLKVAKFRW